MDGDSSSCAIAYFPESGVAGIKLTSIQKRPQVIRDLIELATYMAEDNMDASDRFLVAAEETFKQLAQMPKMGKRCQFSHPNLIDVRQ